MSRVVALLRIKNAASSQFTMDASDGRYVRVGRGKKANETHCKKPNINLNPSKREKLHFGLCGITVKAQSAVSAKRVVKWPHPQWIIFHFPDKKDTLCFFPWLKSCCWYFWTAKQLFSVLRQDTFIAANYIVTTHGNTTSDVGSISEGWTLCVLLGAVHENKYQELHHFYSTKTKQHSPNFDM